MVPICFSCQSTPSTWSSVTAFFNAQSSSAHLLSSSSAHLYPMSRFLAARLRNLRRHCIFGYRSASLVSLYWIVWIADDSIGSLQLDLVHLHYYKDTNSNIVKIKEKRPFSVYSDSEKTSSCNFPIRWTRSMNKKWKPLRTQFDLASV